MKDGRCGQWSAHWWDSRNLSKHSFLIHRKDAKENSSPEVLPSKANKIICLSVPWSDYYIAKGVSSHSITNLIMYFAIALSTSGK